MAFATVPHNQGTSPSSNSIQERDSELTPGAEKKPNFSLGGIRSWITKKKEGFSEGGLLNFPGLSRPPQSRKRDDQSMDNRRHSSTDLIECVDKIEQDATTFQVS